MSATQTRTRKKQATPNADGYVPTLWRCESAPNLTLRLDDPIGRDIQFKRGNYLCRSREEEEVLRGMVAKRKKHRIQQYTGIHVWKCDLCDFMASDEEGLRWHREERHDVNRLLAEAAQSRLAG